jgi:hypothetical protein
MGFAIKNVKFLGCWLLCRMFYRDENADPRPRRGEEKDAGRNVGTDRSADGGVLVPCIIEADRR